jgi:hypothetical protein
MEMIRHEHIGIKSESKMPLRVPNQNLKQPKVRLVFKDPLALIAPVNDMVECTIVMDARPSPHN